MDYSGLINKLIEVFLWICAGYVARKAGVIDDISNNRFSKYIVSIGNPMVLLGTAMSTQSALSNGRILSAVAIGFPWMLAVALVSYGATFLLGKKVPNRGAYAYMMTFGNLGIFGIPVLAPLFGEEGVALASMLNVGLCVLIMSLGFWMISGGKASIRDVARQFRTFPMIVFMTLPLWYILRLEYPPFLKNAVTGLGNTTLPLLMITVGNSLAARKLKDIFLRPRPLLIAVLKLLVIPLAMTPLFRLAVPDPLLANVMVLSTGMPAGGLAVSLSILYLGDGEEASTVVFLTTLLSLVTIPLLVFILF